MSNMSKRHQLDIGTSVARTEYCPNGAASVAEEGCGGGERETKAPTVTRWNALSAGDEKGVLGHCEGGSQVCSGRCDPRGSGRVRIQLTALPNQRIGMRKGVIDCSRRWLSRARRRS